MSTPRELYPPIEPHSTGRLAVDDLHTLYWEECGNPAGAPVVFLHGGPGGGCSPTSRRFFDPARYRILLLDQRGSGRSTPNGELRNNTTAHLIDDLEVLRQHRGLSAWHLFGGSWGSTLAVAYAEAFPQAVLSLTLRGIFLMRRWEIDWIFEAARLFRPDALAAVLEGLPAAARRDPLEAYAVLLEHPDRAMRLEAARRWCVFEATLANLVPDPARVAGVTAENVAHAMARIEVHYFRNNRYVPEDRLIEEAGRIAHIPTSIVQGRYDLLCPPITATQLHRALPQSRLLLIEDAGHSATERNTCAALVSVMDDLVRR